MPVPLYLSGVVIIFAFLDLGKNISFSDSLLSARGGQARIRAQRTRLLLSPEDIDIVIHTPIHANGGLKVTIETSQGKAAITGFFMSFSVS